MLGKKSTCTSNSPISIYFESGTRQPKDPEVENSKRTGNTNRAVILNGNEGYLFSQQSQTLVTPPLFLDTKFSNYDPSYKNPSMRGHHCIAWLLVTTNINNALEIPIAHPRSLGTRNNRNFSGPTDI